MNKSSTPYKGHQFTLFRHQNTGVLLDPDWDDTSSWPLFPICQIEEPYRGYHQTKPNLMGGGRPQVQREPPIAIQRQAGQHTLKRKL
tara:strand:- start:716 stop:976 length:261 start_codon:yes stop_codon:yes gene_type:complete